MGGVPWVTWKHAHVLATAPTLEKHVCWSPLPHWEKKSNSSGKQFTGGIGFASCFQRVQIKVARAEVRLDTWGRMQ